MEFINRSDRECYYNYINKNFGANLSKIFNPIYQAICQFDDGDSWFLRGVFKEFFGGDFGYQYDVLYFYEKSALFNNHYAYEALAAYYRHGKTGFLLNGLGNEKNMDPIKSLEYYKKAAKLGNLIALNMLGVAYQYGKTLHRPLIDKENIEKALQYFQEAATKGNINALRNLTALIAEKDEKTAVINYKNLIAQGDIDSIWSLYKIGKSYANLEGSKKDLIKAIEYISFCAEYHDADSIFDLNYFYKNKDNGISDSTFFKLTISHYLKSIGKKDIFDLQTLEDFSNLQGHINEIYGKHYDLPTFCTNMINLLTKRVRKYFLSENALILAINFTNIGVAKNNNSSNSDELEWKFIPLDIAKIIAYYILKNAKETPKDASLELISTNKRYTDMLIKQSDLTSNKSNQHFL